VDIVVSGEKALSGANYPTRGAAISTLRAPVRAPLRLLRFPARSVVVLAGIAAGMTNL